MDDKGDMELLYAKVNDEINSSDYIDVLKVTPMVVKEASMHLKDGKSDPCHVFSSDCFKHAPDILYQHLATLFRSFLIHGHITTYLLLATLVPIIKNRLGSINTSKNYRSIAISSLVFKLLDWITMHLFDKKLGLDDLQFAYQPGASTNNHVYLVCHGNH